MNEGNSVNMVSKESRRQRDGTVAGVMVSLLMLMSMSWRHSVLALVPCIISAFPFTASGSLLTSVPWRHCQCHLIACVIASLPISA